MAHTSDLLASLSQVLGLQIFQRVRDLTPGFLCVRQALCQLNHTASDRLLGLLMQGLVAQMGCKLTLQMRMTLNPSSLYLPRV